MGTSQGELLSEAVFIRRKVCIANLAFELSGLAVIAVKIRLRGTAGRAGAVLRDVTFFMAGDRLYLNMVPVFKVRNEETPVPFVLEDLDLREFVDFKFLIFWVMGIIEIPLFERDISAHEVDEEAILLIKVLNNRK